MSPPVREALAHGTARLRAAGISSARLDARVLLAKAMDVCPDRIFAESGLCADVSQRFSVLLARRAAREPLAYITGTKEFWSLPFAVGPGVLIPRPESETLVEAALDEFRRDAALNVLDIGTGSGCLLIAFLSERANAAGLGVDLSEEALAWARHNLRTHGMAARCRLEKADWEPSGAGTFDIVFVNPPYLAAAEFALSDPEIHGWEPHPALVAGEDGLEAIRALPPVLRRRLSESGRAFIEVGHRQAAAASEILARSGLDVQRVIPDLSAVPRCLVIGQAGSGGG
ncbi:MAG TPA: peptide chain release factor N(5)-glutamine methyltransferase [Rhizomicrobium sp.]|nr:peptide chain release factor N(5)-glutamine methyltransferase [Rhizomicrobium sp.]